MELEVWCQTHYSFYEPAPTGSMGEAWITAVLTIMNINRLLLRYVKRNGYRTRPERTAEEDEKAERNQSLLLHLFMEQLHTE